MNNILLGLGIIIAIILVIQMLIMSKIDDFKDKKD
jgi:hypothetical protein